MSATVAPVLWAGRRSEVEVLDDAVVVRGDTSGIADRWNQVKIASALLAVAAVVVAGLELSSTLALVLLGLALLPVLGYAVASAVAVVWGVGSLATRRGRRGLKEGLTSALSAVRARTVAESLQARPDHLAVLPRQDLIGVEAQSRRVLVLQTRRGPQPVRARWWHPFLLAALRRELAGWLPPGRS